MASSAPETPPRHRRLSGRDGTKRRPAISRATRSSIYCRLQALHRNRLLCPHTSSCSRAMTCRANDPRQGRARRQLRAVRSQLRGQRGLHRLHLQHRICGLHPEVRGSDARKPFGDGDLRPAHAECCSGPDAGGRQLRNLSERRYAGAGDYRSGLKDPGPQGDRFLIPAGNICAADPACKSVTHFNNTCMLKSTNVPGPLPFRGSDVGQEKTGGPGISAAERDAPCRSQRSSPHCRPGLARRRH